MEVFPVSPAQRSIWIAEQLGTAGAALHAEQAVELDSPVDPGALGQALGEIVRRHAALRTTIALVDGEIRQQVQPYAEIPVPVTDLAHATLAPDAGGGWLRHADARRIITTPFDLAKEFPFRAGLFRLAGGRFGLLVVIHHIASDLVSAQILLSELTALYATFARGEPSRLAPLAVSYAELMSRPRAAGRPAARTRLRSYWTQQLADLPPPIDLARGAPRPRVPSCRGAVLRAELSAAEARRVIALAQAEQVSVFAVTLAAYYLTLAAHSGQPDLLVAVPHLQREDAASAGHIGCFLNMLVLRKPVAGDASVAQFIQHVWNTIIGALEHRELSFAEVVEIASPRRYPGYRTLTQVGFTVAEARSPELDFGPTTGRALTIDRESIAYDLMASVQVLGESMNISFEYCPDIVPEAAARALQQSFIGMLSRMCDGTGLLVRELAGPELTSHSTRPRADSGRAREPGARDAGSTDATPDVRAVTGRLTALWEEVLSGPRPAPENDFFLMGGHSLAMITLIMRIEEEFAIEVPLDDILQLSTLREQAALIARLVAAPAGEQESVSQCAG
jgi:acyl carrier protein